MIYLLFIQWPPTPTPLPGGMPKFDMPTGSGLWGAAPTSIQFWTWLGAAGTALQLILLVGLVIIGMAIVLRFIKQFTRKDAES